MDEAYLLDTNLASIGWDGGHRQHTQVRERLAALEDASISVCSVRCRGSKEEPALVLSYRAAEA